MHSTTKQPDYRRALCGRKAFSLIEVVIAVGIFALAIVGVIGLLSPVNQSVSDVSDADDAARLVGVIQAKLQDLSFDTVKAALQDSDPDAGNSDYDPTADPKALFATRDGSIVGLYERPSSAVWDPASTLSNSEEEAVKFFELVLIRNTDLSPKSNDDSAGYLAFNIRLRWPAFTAEGIRIADRTQQSVLIIPAAITR